MGALNKKKPCIVSQFGSEPSNVAFYIIKVHILLI
jgi:hypothetical protein